MNWEKLSEIEFRLLDELADGFEREIKLETKPRIEAWLPKVDENLRPFLLRELLRIESTYNDAGKDDLLSRFPEHSAMVESVFSSADSTLYGSPPNLPGKNKSTKISVQLPDKYSIKKKIASGGMGAVYRAQQLSPVKREVAIKVIRATPDLAELAKRFEFEMQVLVQLDHPNIAKLFEAGVTLDGLPFFSMEFIPGIPINQFVAKENLSLEQRLKLFLQICDAIQHAHQKGVIHRDIKPNNILIFEKDGELTPKVIDFGLAKAFDEFQEFDKPAFETGEGQLLGTINYMSPEQARYDHSAIDIRSDVYSLGIVLYELLTGSTPLQLEQVTAVGIAGALGIIEESNYPAPSNRIRELTGKNGKTPTGNSIRFNRELDLVVLKAISAEPDRRYITVQELAHDIDHYLHCRPVSAKADSMAYSVSKFIKRNRVSCLVAAVLIFASVFGIAFTVVQYDKAQQAQSESALKSAQLEILETQSALDKALLDKAKAEAAQKNAKAESADTMLEIFSRAFIETDPRFSGQEKNLVDVLDTFYFWVENSDFLDEQKGKWLYALSIAYRGNEQPERALQAVEDCMQIAETLFAADDLDLIITKDQLAKCLWDVGDRDKAILIFEELAQICPEALGPGNKQTLACRSHLARVYSELGDYDKAITAFEDVIALQKKHLPENDPDILTAQQNLALTYRDIEDFDKAIELLKSTYQKASSVFTSRHERSIDVGYALVQTYLQQGNYLDAADLEIKILGDLEKNYGDRHHLDLAYKYLNVAITFSKAEDFDSAIKLFEEFVPVFEKKMPSESLAPYRWHYYWGEACLGAEKIDQAVVHLRKALAGLEAALGSSNGEVAGTRKLLIKVLKDAGRTDEAQALVKDGD